AQRSYCSHLEEHFGLGYSHSVGGLTAAASNQKLQASGHSVHHSGNTTKRRNHGFVYHVGSFFHSIHGPIDEFIGANYLQTGAVDHVADSGVHSLKLSSKHGGGMADIFRDRFHLRPKLN